MKKILYAMIFIFLASIQFYLINKIIEQKNTLIYLTQNINTNNNILSSNNKKLNDKKIEKDELTKSIKSNKLALSKSKDELSTLLKNTKPITRFTANSYVGKIAYLTFDDGPSENTLKILSILKKYNVKATFFVNGSNSNFALQCYKNIVNDGHSIGNHTYSHNYSTIYKNIASFKSDIKKLEDKLKNSVGICPKIVRFPGGSNNTVSHQYGGKFIMRDLSKYLIDNGYTYFDWNVSSTDAAVNLQSKGKIVSSVLNGSKYQSPAIILMHDSAVKKTTVEALPEIIEGLKEQGFEFSSLSPNEYIVQFLRAQY